MLRDIFILNSVIKCSTRPRGGAQREAVSAINEVMASGFARTLTKHSLLPHLQNAEFVFIVIVHKVINSNGIPNIVV